MTKANKSVKIEIRVTPDQKELLRAAAASKDLPMSAWILGIAIRSAHRLVVLEPI